MRTLSPILSFALSCACIGIVSAEARAQVALDPNFGTALRANDDSMHNNNLLGFPFEFPGGLVVSAIDIDSNGRVVPPGSDTSDRTESVNEMLGQAPSICALWDDLDPNGAGTDDVYFNAYNDGISDLAVVTWKDVTRFGAPTPFTVQLILRANGSFSMFWDARVPMMDAIVGVSSGNGALDPVSPADFDCGSALITLGDPTIYEHFAPGTFDLAGNGIEFYPDGNGGWVIITPFTGTCPIPQPRATARIEGVGCGGSVTPTSAIEYTPDALGGYVVVPSARAYDNNLGVPLGSLGDDSTAVANLGFNFVMPGGVVVSSLVVDTNGRLMQSGGSDYSPTMAEFLNDPTPVIAPAWGDWNVTDGDSTGTIMFRTNAIDYAVITWDGIAQYLGSYPLRMQVQLFGDQHPGMPNGWTCVYEDMDSLDVQVSLASTNWIVGCSPGHGAADPGEFDMSGVPTVTNGVATIYEFFDRGVPETWDIGLGGVPGLALRFDTRPIVGATFDLELTNVPSSATGAWMLLGFRNLGVDLTPIGAPCTLYSSAALSLPITSWSPGQPTANYSLPISGADGIPIVLQGAVIDTGANPLGILLSNAVLGTTGG